ncbi:MAG: carbonic anhydrase [Pseudomonadales bacterium]
MKERKKTRIKEIQQLIDGNLRFVRGEPNLDIGDTDALRTQLSDGQKPFAIVLGCSDSRVPVEIIFDQWLGDLFVIRIAGNIVNASQIASVEFAVEQFDVGLVVVLGHSGCGAIQATIQGLTDQPENLDSHIVQQIRPVLEPLLAEESDHHKLMSLGVRRNVERSVQLLTEGSSTLAGRCSENHLSIVGAEYDLKSGAVAFY